METHVASDAGHATSLIVPQISHLYLSIYVRYSTHIMTPVRRIYAAGIDYAGVWQPGPSVGGDSVADLVFRGEGKTSRKAAKAQRN